VSAAKTRVAGIAAAGWSVAGVILAIAPSESTIHRVLGIVLALLFGGIAVFAGLQELRGRTFVALLPDGVLGRSVAGDSFVPWDAIEAVGVVKMSDTPLVVIRATDPAAVESPRWAKLFARGTVRWSTQTSPTPHYWLRRRTSSGRSSTTRSTPRNGPESDKCTATIRDRRAPFPGSSIGRASGC
jgi:hypothetical protein